MRGFLRFLALFALLVAFLVLVALPLAAGPFLTQMVRDAGPRSDSLAVTVALLDPSLLLGRSRSMHLSAAGVDLAPARVGSIELTLGGVSLFDRTWETVDGQISDVSLTSGGETVRLDAVSVSGPAEAATATARLSSAEAENLVRVAAEHEGLHLDDVTVDDRGVNVTIAGVEQEGRLEVRGGALVLFPGNHDPVPLVQPTARDGWQLDEAWLGEGGLNVRATVDTTQLASELGGAGSIEDRP